MTSGYPGRVRLQFSSSTAGALAGLSLPPTMHLMYTLDENGNRVYTLKVCHYVYSFITIFPQKAYIPFSSQKITDAGKITKSAHPGSHFSLVWRLVFYVHFAAARFSPVDKFSRHRVTIKKRYGILPTQLPSKPL